jgi:hypothetical protein
VRDGRTCRVALYMTPINLYRDDGDNFEEQQGGAQ